MPKKWAQTRLTALRAKYGLSRLVIQSASVVRVLTPAFHCGAPPSRKRASYSSSLPATLMTRRAGSSLIGEKAPKRGSCGRIPEKNAAYSQNCFFDQLANG